MFQKHSNSSDEANGLLAGIPASSRSGPAAGNPVVLIQFQAGNRRRLDGLESEIDPIEESFESLGSISVRLVAEWSLPRCQMLLRRMET